MRLLLPTSAFYLLHFVFLSFFFTALLLRIRTTVLVYMHSCFATGRLVVSTHSFTLQCASHARWYSLVRSWEGQVWLHFCALLFGRQSWKTNENEERARIWGLAHVSATCSQSVPAQVGIWCEYFVAVLQKRCFRNSCILLLASRVHLVCDGYLRSGFAIDFGSVDCALRLRTVCRN